MGMNWLTLLFYARADVLITAPSSSSSLVAALFNSKYIVTFKHCGSTLHAECNSQMVRSAPSLSRSSTEMNRNVLCRMVQVQKVPKFFSSSIFFQFVRMVLINTIKSLSFGALTRSKNTSESWANPAKSSPGATATKKKKFEIKWKQSMHLRFVGGWALSRPPNLVEQGPYNNQDPTLSCTRITQSLRYKFSKRWEIKGYTALFSHCPLSFWVDVRDDRAMNSHESPYQAIPLPRPSPTVVILGQGKGGMVGFNDFNRLVNEPCIQ